LLHKILKRILSFSYLICHCLLIVGRDENWRCPVEWEASIWRCPIKEVCNILKELILSNSNWKQIKTNPRLWTETWNQITIYVLEIIVIVYTFIDRNIFMSIYMYPYVCVKLWFHSLPYSKRPTKATLKISS
jgi:hypothetical protein